MTQLADPDEASSPEEGRVAPTHSSFHPDPPDSGRANVTVNGEPLRLQNSHQTVPVVS